MSEEKKDPFDGDYIGNIWGWKFSLFGLLLILSLGGLMAYRHYALDVPLGWEEPGAPASAPAQDTVDVRSTD